MEIKLPVLFLVILLLVYKITIVPQHWHFLPSSTTRYSISLSKVHAQTTKHLADATQKLIYYAPKTLSIPKIGLTANVISVGLNNEHAMDVPNNFVDVGWYNLGYKPGEHGSTVLDGHYDNFHGQPAVFYYLDTLSRGDKIVVTDENGKQFTYTVTDNMVYQVNALPLQQIFASNDATRLNIITCHGIWDNSIQTYNQRTVIYSVLADSSSSI